MSVSRADVESIIVADVGGLMAYADMTVTVAGSNADLNSSIARALLEMGHNVTDITSVSDADVAAVSDSERVELLDLVTLHALEAILGNLDDVDLQVGPRSEKFSQIAAQAQRRLDTQMDKCKSLYSFGESVPVAGVITLDFATHGDD